MQQNDLNYFSDVLYLGSQSKSRQNLLNAAKISYKILSHGSQESVSVSSENFDEYVVAIATDKMRHLQLPDTKEVARPYIFVLTADTLVKAIYTGQIIGKPEDTNHAKAILRLIRTQPLQITTGCCLKLFERVDESWNEKDSRVWATGAQVEFVVQEDELDLYLKTLPEVIYASGASIIDNFGQSFLKSINGSHSAVIGLPLFELRHYLQSMGFKF